MKRWNRDLPGRLAVLLMSTLVLASCVQGDAEDQAMHYVGGTIAGLAGTIVLQNRGTDDLTLSQNGPFTFATSLKTGSTYDVSVATQPTGQICDVLHGSGTVLGEVVDVVVVCFDDSTHTLGGVVAGLVGTVVLRNGTEDLSIDANGSFAFFNRLNEGDAYSVSIATQPVNQVCSVTNGSGTVPAADVTNVTVTCVTNAPPVVTYSIGGVVSGLGVGKTLRLGLQHSGSVGNPIDVTSNGQFNFDPVEVPAGAAYVVSIATQPVDQVCSVTNGTGTMPAADVTNVAVICVNNPPPVVTYSIGGVVSGLDVGKTLRLGLQHSGNVGNTIDVTSNGQFNFDPVKVPAGAAYVVSVATQPPDQACAVSNGTGIANSNVTNVAVSCVGTTTSYSVGGTVTGLGVGKTVELGLRRSGNLTSSINVSTNGPFSFDPVKVAAGQTYVVSVESQPAEQTCSVTNGSGIANSNVTNVAVACVTTTPTYSIGGAVSGLDAGKTLPLRLEHSGGSTSSLNVTANGPFVFEVKVAAGQPYLVSVISQPAEQTCSVTNGSGTANANVTNIEVACVATTTSYSVGGTITGLTGVGLRIENGTDNAVTPGAGTTTFTLPTEFENGDAYDVGIAAQPAAQTCLITLSQGVVASADVANIRVTCIDNVTSPLAGTYTVPALSATDTSYVYLTLFPDGGFIYAGIENTSGCGSSPDGNGIEYGVYNYNAASGAFSIREVVVDTNGGCGLWHNNSRADGTLTVSGSGQARILTLTMSRGGTIDLVPVPSTPGLLYGSFADAYRRNFWLFLDAGGGGVYFLDTETQAGTSPVTTGPVAGLEYACGAVGTAAGGTLSRDFSVFCLAPAPEVDGPVDTNGTAGLSHFGSWEFSVNGDALTSSTFNGMRVVPN